MSKCVFNKKNPNIDLEDTLMDLCESVWDTEGNRERKTLFIDGLKELGEGYDSTSLSSLADYIREYVSGNYPDLSSVIPINTDIYLAGKSNNISNEVQEQESKTLVLESPDSVDDSILKRNFISKAYGTASEVQLTMERDLKKSIVDSFIVNRKKGIVIGDTATLNSEVRGYQESLLQNIVTFLRMSYSEANSKKYDVGNILKELDDLTMYKDGVYTSAINRINELSQPFLNPTRLTADVLNNHYSNYLAGHITSKRFIQAYNSYVVLNNFDTLLELTLGKTLEINPELRGEFSTDIKYSLNGINNLATNWRSSEDIHPEKEIGNIPKLLIETTPMYLWQSSSPLSTRDVGLQEFNYIVSKVKDMVNVSTSRETKFDGIFFNEFPEFGKYRQYLYGMTMYDLVARIRTNPQRVLPMLFELSTNPRFFTIHSSTLYKGFYRPDMDLLYSVHKGIFEDSPLSLYGIMKNSSSKTNYFGYVTQLIDSISSIKYAQYYKDENGNIQMRTLKDSSMNVVKMVVESRINGMLSIMAPIKYIDLIDKYKAAYTDGKFSFSIPSTGLQVVYNPKVKRNQAFDVYRTGESGGITRVSFFNGKSDWDSLMDFFNDFLKVDFSPMSTYMTNYLSLKSIGETPQYDSAISDLLHFSTSVFFNSYVSHELIRPEMLWDSLNSILEETYGLENKPNFIKSSGEINLVSNAYTPVLSDLANASSMTSGTNTSSVVKDGDGNGLASVTITRLFDSYPTQWVTQCMYNVDSPTKAFSLLDNPKLLRGVITSREYKDGDQTKQHSSFNVAESYFSSLVYDYVGSLVGHGDDTIRLNEAGFMPSVNSDKTFVLKMLIGMNEMSKAKKVYSKLTKAEVRGLINSEIGTCYGKILDNIAHDYNKLNEFAVSVGNNVPINPLTNFAEFNAAYGKNAAEQLSLLVDAYNNIHRNGIIELVDQVHLINNKGQLAFNRSLMSITNRFNPMYFKSKGYNPEEVFGRLTGVNEFWNLKERELLSSLLDNNFGIETTDSLGRSLTSPEISYLSSLHGWIHQTTKRVVLAKFTPTGGKAINISKWSDFGDIGYTEKDTFGRDVRKTYLSDGFDITKLNGTLELHPTIANHNALDFLFSQEYMLTTVGSHIAHPAKKAASATFDLVEEAARHVAQYKRNVSFTASMHIFQQGMLNGIPSEYTTAVIDDLSAVVFNIMGDYDEKGAKPYDGATFVNPFIVYLENNSLAGAKAGIDKKQFVHAYRERTCTGIIVKTAGFGLTNDLIKNSLFYQLMMKKMTNHQWLDHLGNPYIVDITKGYNGQIIQYDDMYYKGTDGKFYMINSIESNGDNTYSIIKSEVEPDGTIIRELPLEITNPINTNYDLWNMFGGMRSRSLKDGELVPSEVSITNVVKAMNSTGVVLNQTGEVTTQDDIYQVLKHSDVHYVPTSGAVKQGASNINSADQYTSDKNYSIGKMKMNNAGIQLDPGHKADEANLSIMTQVISSLASRGYTAEKAQEVYDALSGLTEYGIKEYIDGYGEYLESGNPEKFQDVIVKTIVNSLLNTSSTEESIVQATAQALLDKAKEGKELTFKDTKGIIPYSDPSVFNQLVSTITSSLNKSAIRVKFAGTLAVLNPSHGIWKLYGDRKLESFNNQEEINNLQALYDTKPLKSISEIQLGRSYNVTVNGVMTSRLIETPKQYWALQSELNGIEATIVENILPGRDLATYNIHFSDVNGNTYNMWDLDIVKAMYSFREGVDNIKNANDDASRVTALATMREWLTSNNLSQDTKQAYKQLQASMQRVLGALGSGDLSPVFVRGQSIIVDRDNVNISAYETIMPKIYMSKFGLNQYDSLEVIEKDGLFFVKRMLANWQSKVDDADFDVELKRLNGKHTYLIGKASFKSTTLSPLEIDKGWDGNKVYRKNAKGENMYRLASEDDMVYVDANGNEVIVTDDLGFYIGSNSYHTLRISDSAANSSHFDNILIPVLEAQSKVAKRFVRYIGKKDPVSAVLDMNTVYRISLDAIRKNPNKPVSDPAIQMIYDSAMEAHTSFVKSLNILAARIPSQTMQSFMPMKVVAFDNPDVNSAYVNYWQIWLQGSDFDIDKVSLLGYSFDRSGKYIGWSPYFNLNSVPLLKKSEKLPFPNGKEVIIQETDDNSLTEWINQYIGSGNLFNFGGDGDVIFLLDYDENGKLNSLDKLSTFLRNLPKNGSGSNVLYIPSNSELPFEKFAGIINRHNLYLGSLKGEAGMDMIRNFISTYMYSISIDPINLVQSQSPVDLGEPQAAAENSSAGALVKTFTPGNTVSKHISLIENMVGKDVIGISAAGMKDFFALTQYYNDTIRGGNPKKQSYLLFDKTIAGQNVRLLANSFVENPSEITYQELAAALESVDNSKDAALILSAILSCATDNAKELVLSKINAGADMVSLYIYGIAIGIDFDKLASIMMSRAARVINKIKSGNIFNNDEGIPFLQSVFNYVDDGPSLDGLDYELIANVSALLKNSDAPLPYIVRGLLIKEMYNSNGSDFLMSRKVEIIQSMKDIAHRLTGESSRISSFKFIDKLEEYVSNLKVIMSDGGSTYSTIRDLYNGGSELRRLGGILGLNQGLDTKIDSKLNFIRSFENLFTDRFNEFSKNKSVRRLQLAEQVLLNGQTSTREKVFSELAQFVRLDNMVHGVVPESVQYKISFNKFVTDEAYRNTIIEYYNGVKHTFNILDVAWTLPHFRGYLKTAFIDYEAQKSISSKFRAIDTLGSRVLQEYGSKSSKDIRRIYKGVQSFLDHTLINSWMKSASKVIEVQEGVTIFSKNGEEVTTTERTPLMLGTDWGNASFKRWMDTMVIPNLKEGILGERAKIFMNNKFIKDLTPIRIDRTITKNATFVYTLPISMIPKSDSEKASYILYRSEFNKLQSLRYFGHPVSDLFFYYNLINFRNTTTQNSLTPMFGEMLREGTSSLLKEYNSFVSVFDTDSDLIEDIDYHLKDVVIWCAPKGDINTARTNWAYAYDYDSRSYKLYERVTASNSYVDDNDEGNAIEVASSPGKSKLSQSENYQIAGQRRNSKYFLTPLSSLTSNKRVRISSTTAVEVDSGSILEINFEGKRYTQEALLDKLKELGGSKSDLEVPYVVKRVGNTSEKFIDTDVVSQLINHIFKNPC